MELNYNNTVVPSIVDFVKSCLDNLTKYDNKQRKIYIKNYQVASDDSNDIYYYIRNGLTYEFNIVFNFVIEETDGNKIEDTFELSVPKLINNTFVVNGNRRSPTTVLGSDSECRTYSSEDGEYIRFDYDRKVYFGNVLKIEIIEDWENSVTFDGTAENFAKYKNLLKLSERQINKLKVKLDSDNVPEYITEDLCKRLFELGPDKYNDSIIDKLFINPEKALLINLKSRETRRSLMKTMRSKLYQYNTVYARDIQNCINKYFKNAQDSSLEIPTNVNPLVYNALSAKLIFPKYIPYNLTFSDIIDPVNTPANNNVNRINEFNVCASIEDGDPYIKCYEYPSFKRVKLHYFKYLNCVVISNKSVDYKNKSIKPSGSKIYVKKRFKESSMEVSELKTLKYVLIEPKPDEKLSLTSRQIPLLNMSDTERVAMGTGMSKQAIELENAEAPLISSGNAEEDEYLDTTKIFYEGESGEIKKINDRTIYIKDENGDILPYEIPSTIIGMNNNIISYVVKVKVGDKVTRGQELISSYVTRNKSYNLGVNARVAYMFYKGFNHEDAIIISESFAKKCVGYQIIDVQVPIMYDDEIQSIIPIGTRCQSQDVLVNRSSTIRMRTNTKKAWELPIMKFARLDRYNSNVQVPNSIELGFVTDVDYTINSNWESMTKLKATYEESKKNIEILTDYVTKNKTFLHSSDEVPSRYWNMHVPSPEITNEDEQVMMITIRILKVSYCIKGSKFCNRWGSKGEVSLILPDNEMPTGEDGKPFDMLLNPPSVIKRKNPSQLIETLLSKIIDKVTLLAKDLISKDDIKGARELVDKYFEDQYTNLSDEEFTKGIIEDKEFLVFKVGSYSTYGRDKVLEMAKSLDVSEKEYVTDPDPEIGELEEPVVTGRSYYMRLYHSSDYTAKVTSSIVDSKEPITGRGYYREEGQKIGEMENWALMAHGVDQLLKPNSLLKEGVFLNELLLAGYSLELNGRPVILSENFKRANELLKK